MNEANVASGYPTPPAPNDAGPGLSEFERVTKVFYEPSKTFADLRRNAMWLVPFLLMVLFSITFVVSVSKKVGWEQVVENGFKVMPPSQLEKYNRRRRSSRPRSAREY